jgi:hypothetical protein
VISANRRDFVEAVAGADIGEVGVVAEPDAIDRKTASVFSIFVRSHTRAVLSQEAVTIPVPALMLLYERAPRGRM